MNLALFDLDNTLLNGDSDFEWAQFLIGKGVLDREVHEARNIEFFEHYKAGTLDIHAFLDFQLAPLARHPRARARCLAPRIPRHAHPPADQPRRALAGAKAPEAGDLLAIVTATNSFVTGPIAREFGIPHLIATIPAQEDGRFTGKPRGTARLPRRQDRARRGLAGIARPLAGRLRAKLVLQRFAQRPAAAAKGHPPGCRRCRRHLATDDATGCASACAATRQQQTPIRVYSAPCKRRERTAFVGVFGDVAEWSKAHPC
jgi:phosphoserine phosphatase